MLRKMKFFIYRDTLSSIEKAVNFVGKQGLHKLTQSFQTMASSGVMELEDKNCRHLFDGDDILNVYNLDVVSLSAGAPGPDLLKKCIPLFEEVIKHRMNAEKEHAYLFQYGITSGLWEYRNLLSKFLTARYGDTVNRQDLILTCGAAHGLTLVMNTFLPWNAVIFVEEVSYMIALDSFKQFPSMKLVTVPMNDDGIDLDAFEQLLAREKSSGSWELSEEKLFCGMFYTVPFFHNPTGITTSQRSCENIVRIAREMGLLVICDDVYNLLYYGENEFPPRRLFFHDRSSGDFNGGNVISNGTFSKILAPGVRVGWLEAGPRLARILRNSGILKSGGAVNQYMSGIVTSILELGLMDSHLNHLIVTLKNRMAALCDVLDSSLPSYCSYRRPEGGYFVWIKLPESVDSVKFTPWCVKKYKVSAVPGCRFSPTGNFKNYLRLTVAFHETETLKRAAENLCRGISDYVENEIS